VDNRDVLSRLFRHLAASRFDEIRQDGGGKDGRNSEDYSKLY